MKGLILSGGKGTRLRPITHTSAKQLVPVANKPVLFYGIEAIAAAGINEIGIIIAPETGERSAPPSATARASASRSPTSSRTTPAGLAHAVLTAEPFLGDEPFVMYLGDNLLQGGITELVERFRGERAGRADPAHAGAGPRELRRRRARRRPRRARWSRSRRSRAATSRSSASTCSRRRPRGGARDRAERARRARDHRRDPAPGRQRPARRAAHRARAGGRTRASSRTCSRPTG